MFAGRDIHLVQTSEDLRLSAHKRYIHVKLARGFHRAADDLAGRVIAAHGVNENTHSKGLLSPARRSAPANVPRSPHFYFFSP